MGRLQVEFLERVETFADRMLDVTEVLEQQCRPRRIVDQMVGAGTSVGANTFEADEALSRLDFCKCIGIAIKELNESRFWLRLVGRRGWIPKRKLADLEREAAELKLICGAMLTRSRRNQDRRPG
jgi:four helix bundle protein